MTPDDMTISDANGNRMNIHRPHIIGGDTTGRSEPMHSDTGSVAKGNTCGEHGAVCKTLGELTALTDLQERRGDRMETAITRIDTAVTRIETKLENGGIKAKPSLSTKDKVLLAAVMLAIAQGPQAVEWVKVLIMGGK